MCHGFSLTAWPLAFFNKFLVAIIGNKGIGKTALAEAIGLLGNCQSAQSFFFLSDRKFRQTKNNKARDFEATLTWRDGHHAIRKLSELTDPDMPRAVSYIPQSYLEAICNEVHNAPGSQFDAEHKSVIFSHVADHKRFDAESLDDLIRFQAEPIEQRIASLRADLQEINKRVLELESRPSSANRQLLLNLKASKERELKTHDKLKPAEKLKPDVDPAQQSAMESIGQQIGPANGKRDTLQATIRALDGAKKTAAAQVARAARISQLLQNFASIHQTLMRNLEADCKVLGVDPAALIAITLNRAPITAADNAANKLLGKEDSKIAQANTELDALKDTIDFLTQQLDAPNSAYQKYGEALRLWTERRTEIVGKATARDTLSYVEAQIKDLNDVPKQLSVMQATRVDKTKDIFAQIEAMVGIYRALYHPVQIFIMSHQVAKGQLHMEFDASIIASKWEEVILAKANQGKEGDFLRR